jgi:4-hydroxybenzoate polyprenyltransferase
MRGAGCIINDMWDRDFDRKVRLLAHPAASLNELYFFDSVYAFHPNNLNR